MAPKKILLADDSETVLRVERFILGREPCEILVAKDGRGALELALREQPDLVLLDMLMPGLTGLEVLVRLRQEATMRSTPVIMITTRGEMKHMEAAYAAGCTDYLTKPFNAGELLRRVRYHLGREVLPGAGA